MGDQRYNTLVKSLLRFLGKEQKFSGEFLGDLIILYTVTQCGFIVFDFVEISRDVNKGLNKEKLSEDVVGIASVKILHF